MAAPSGGPSDSSCGSGVMGSGPTLDQSYNELGSGQVPTSLLCPEDEGGTASTSQREGWVALEKTLLGSVKTHL